MVNKKASKDVFSEIKMPTKYGWFMFRVYKNSWGRETILIYTPNLNIKKEVLVRIHSECITSEVFHSQLCDCFEQLDLALKLISKNDNGCLVYLRQEGMGLGLFKKIKAMSLVSDRIDLYEANKLVGKGAADKRDFNEALEILEDFGIEKVNLITNNLEKLKIFKNSKIKLVGNTPIIIKPNKHNKKEMISKKNSGNYKL